MCYGWMLDEFGGAGSSNAEPRSCQAPFGDRVLLPAPPFPQYSTFPQAPKLSTAPLGRNRSGGGKGGVQVASAHPPGMGRPGACRRANGDLN